MYLYIVHYTYIEDYGFNVEYFHSKKSAIRTFKSAKADTNISTTAIYAYKKSTGGDYIFSWRETHNIQIETNE